MKKYPIRVAITGGAGHLAYSLLFRIASGTMFGPDQPISLRLIETPEAATKLEGVTMELGDCAFPLLHELVATTDMAEGFRGANWIFLAGGQAYQKGVRTADLLTSNAKIFWEQGCAIQKHASFDVRILVVANPCNTNCWVAKENAPDIPANRWMAMTLLDSHRAKSALAKKAGVHVTEVTNLGIWGNHSNTQYADFLNAKIHNKPVTDVITDKVWLEKEFLSVPHHHRTEVTSLLNHSPAASAASAIVDTVRFLIGLAPTDDWFNMAICSDGSYGIEKSIFSSFPIYWKGDKEWEIVQNIRLNDFSRAKIDESINELIQEREAAKKVLGLTNNGKKKKG